jgi:hypothetical protein
MAVLLPGLADTLLSYLALRLLLQLRVEFLHQLVEALYLLVLGLAALHPALQPERGHLRRKAGLHVAHLLPVAQHGPAIELAGRVDGHDRGVDVRGLAFL